MHTKYKELDLSYNQPLMNELDNMLNFIKDKNYGKRVRDRGLTRDYMLQRVNGNTLKEVMASPRPPGDFHMRTFNQYKFLELEQEVRKAFENETGITEYELIVMGRNWYPAVGYMGWHDDKKYQGYRLYCAYAEEDNKAFFRYRDYETGDIVTSWEKAGWNFRMFYINPEPERLLWHTIYTDTLRISIGHRFIV